VRAWTTPVAVRSRPGLENLKRFLFRSLYHEKGEGAMGDWGPEPWESDEAADWFHTLWRRCDFSVLVDEIMNFDERKERYDSFRAASYVLQTLGNPYMWPQEHTSILKDLLDKSISVLEDMINPPNDAWGFLKCVGMTQKW
jgi:hypothetical protein